MIAARFRNGIHGGRIPLRNRLPSTSSPTPARRSLNAITRRDAQITSSPSSAFIPSKHLRRRDDNAAAAAIASRPPPPSYIPPAPPAALPASSSPSPSDEASLRAHFDVPYTPSPSGTSSGLFLYPPLTSPTALPRLTDRTLIHASAIVQRIIDAPLDPTGKELRLVVKNLDRLSDVLCGVIDMCELVRNVHPEEEWVAQSDLAYERLCSFMNELNTDRGLYEALTATISHPHAQPLSEAEMQVALTFLRDFEKSGIHLPGPLRARFVELSDSLIAVGRTFLSYASAGPPQTPRIEIPDADRLLAGMGSRFIESLPRGALTKRSSRYVVPGSWEAQMITRFAREGEARQLVYMGNMRADPERVAVLDRMMSERAELAGVLGKSNWAEVALVDKMAKTPENVMGFLQSLANHHHPAAAADIAALQRLKATSLTGNPISPDISTASLPPLYAWDRDFYAEKLALSLNASSLPPISPFFSTGTVLLGLSRLFTRLYGISFRPSPVSAGEVWHPSVRRLDVVDESEGLIGVIYCDLFSREGKPPTAAHYTVRCSRRVDDDDLRGDRLPEGWDAAYGPGLEEEGVRQRGRDGRYQLPIVVLTTDFGTAEPGRPALLSWTDVETLFHEMGHAIHSMIGRTEYHNVSGTRCATDFVELPSILMEHFVSSPSVLGLFATHYSTDEPLPTPLINAHLSLQSSLAALETHFQIMMAMLDQLYHSIRPSDLASFDSSKVFDDLQQEMGVLPPPRGLGWQTQFGHLYGYGATYYSYLFDRAIAGKVWSTLFNHTQHTQSPLAGQSEDWREKMRDSGEVLKGRLLKWGGGRDPWEMVGDVIGGKEGEAVSRGDEKAMKIVGSWMIK